MFERYTERARRAIFFAHYEASQYGSPYIESEHLLLGLMREDTSLASRFIPQGRSVAPIRREIESQIIIRERISTSVEVPLSQECKHILNHAVKEADQLKHRDIGTEHVLLGILRERKCLAAKILEARGVTLDTIRENLASATQKAGEVIGTTQGAGDVVTVEPGTESIEIREVVLQLFAAWMAQDAKKVASLFHEEGQFIDAQGDLWVGRRDIEKGAERFFSSSGGARIQGEIEDIKCVGTEIAVVTIVWEIEKQPQTLSSIKLRMTVVLTEADHGWTVVSAHATEIRPQSPTS